MRRLRAFSLAAFTALSSAAVDGIHAEPPPPSTAEPAKTPAPPEGGAVSAPAGDASGTPAEAKVADSYPDDPRLEVVRAMMAKGRFDAAEVTARAVLAAHPKVDRARAMLGIALLKQKKYEEARGLLEQARDSSQAFPERKHASHFLGWCCYHLGELGAARTAFELHLTAVPKEPDSIFGLGLVAIGEDRLDDADTLLAQSLEGFCAQPKPDRVGQARALTRLSDVAMRRGDVAKAESLLERAVEASAIQHETWSKLARVRDRLGKSEAADAARTNADRILAALGRRTADETGRTGQAGATPTSPASSAADPPEERAPAASPPAKERGKEPTP